MKTQIIKSGIFTLVFLFANSMLPVAASTLYKWIDSEGNIIYSDEPPSGNVEFEEQIFEDEAAEGTASQSKSVELLIEEAALKNPVSLYTVPECDTCDLIRLYLTRNRIPFAEKNVENNISMQQELKQKSGSISVPTLSIGDAVMDGYSRTAIRVELVNHGFPMDEIESGQEEASVSAEVSDIDDEENLDEENLDEDELLEESEEGEESVIEIGDGEQIFDQGDSFEEEGSSDE